VDTDFGIPRHCLQQLSCYLPGILTLGASTLPEISPKEKEIHRWAAHGLAYTCATSFTDQETGLGPEEIGDVEAWNTLDGSG
jgi:mannosyl-oligosaccharide alpha-1,2-mannosidase